jgi:hypothetical protein
LLALADAAGNLADHTTAVLAAYRERTSVNSIGRRGDRRRCDHEATAFCIESRPTTRGYE